MDYMAKHAKSLKGRIDQLEKENERLKATVKILLMEKDQWLKSKEQWTQIMQSTLTSSNEATSKVSEEIHRLKEENRRLIDRINTLEGK